ncbi:MAG: hypothetical protein PPP58_11640 [Natronomonas sp.]
MVVVMLWSGVSFGWFLGGEAPATFFVLGYGWLAIAGYGAILLVGIAATHSEAVATAVNPNEELET